MTKEACLADLNTQQKESLLYTDGPLLVLAGAGSGKTKVIAHKYAYLTKCKGFSPSSIFTVTFTNKAADEMKKRICSLLSQNLPYACIGTFHSLCSSILRREISVFGYRPEFVIYNNEDQHSLVRHILKELKIHEALYKGVTSRISALKATLVTPEEFLSSGNGFGFDEKLAKVYIMYQDELRRCNALDFDDLIMLTVKLFEKNPDILQRYHEKFQYILVDEFQDINHAQYHLVKLLVSGHRRISAVGDDDQSIYRFRGAEVKNILKFEKDFPDVKVIKLEQNYRSTQNILDVSGSVISKNPMRKAKQLWTERERGEQVTFYWLSNEEEEAKYIVKTIKEIYLKGVHSYGDIAVLYRINLQSRAIEEIFKKEKIPYRVIGGISFYERREIKDIIAYLRLYINIHDNVSIRRIINIPPRGIGSATLNKIEMESKKRDISLYNAIKNICKSKSCSQEVINRLNTFSKLLHALSDLKDLLAIDAIKSTIKLTGYTDGLEEKRLQNIVELIVSAEGMTLRDFLDRISLFTRLDECISDSPVSLMTLHTAKGLEFPMVFIVGMEEGLLPYFKSLGNDEELYEERRLFYVGMTRAKDNLILMGVRKRRIFSKLQEQELSRFIADVPKSCFRWIEKAEPVKPKCNGPDRKEKSLIYVLPYKTGCRIRHPRWGVGVIRDCYGEGDDLKVCVNFLTVGIKRLALKFAHLEMI